jgi:hypothetical protein
VPGLAIALAAHPLFPFLGPEGLRAYDLVIDHFRHGAAIKRLIREWRPPHLEAATASQLPLHILGIVGLASFLAPGNRRKVGGFLVLVVGYLFAIGAQRFMVLFGLLAVPVITGNLREVAPLLGRWPARIGAGALLAAGLALMVPAAAAARRTPHAADQPDYPSRAARWIGAHAPERSRLFMPYTGAQWLMWHAPRVGLYITPHFSFGSEHMVRFFDDIMPHPARFEEEVRRFDVNLALVDLVGESRALHTHLDAARDWGLVYFDGFYAVYARRTPANDALLERHGYRALRARLSFDYLSGVTDEVLAPDVERLSAEAPLVAGGVRAFRLLRGGGAGTAAGVKARDQLLPAVEQLPSSPALLGYLVEAHALAGDRAAAVATLERALTMFPKSARLQALVTALRPGR